MPRDIHAVWDLQWIATDNGFLLYQPIAQGEPSAGPTLKQTIDLGWAPTSMAWTRSGHAIIASPSHVAILTPNANGVYAPTRSFERDASGVIASWSGCPPETIGCLMLVKDRQRVLAVELHDGKPQVVSRYSVVDESEGGPVVLLEGHDVGLGAFPYPGPVAIEMFSGARYSGSERVVEDGMPGDSMTYPYTAAAICCDYGARTIIVSTDGKLHYLGVAGDERVTFGPGSSFPWQVADEVSGPCVGAALSGAHSFHLCYEKAVGHINLYNGIQSMTFLPPGIIARWMSSPIDSAVRLFPMERWGGDNVPNQYMIPGRGGFGDKNPLKR